MVHDIGRWPASHLSKIAVEGPFVKKTAMSVTNDDPDSLRNSTKYRRIADAVERRNRLELRDEACDGTPVHPAICAGIPTRVQRSLRTYAEVATR